MFRDSSSAAAPSDFVTVKYDTNGIEQWVQLYNGPGNSYDGAYVIAVDNNRNVLVAGYSTGAGTDYDYITIKYSQGAKTNADIYCNPDPKTYSNTQASPDVRRLGQHRQSVRLVIRRQV